MNQLQMMDISYRYTKTPLLGLQNFHLQHPHITRSCTPVDEVNPRREIRMNGKFKRHKETSTSKPPTIHLQTTLREQIAYTIPFTISSIRNSTIAAALITLQSTLSSLHCERSHPLSFFQFKSFLPIFGEI